MRPVSSSQLLQMTRAIAPLSTMHDFVPDMDGRILYCGDFVHSRRRVVYLRRIISGGDAQIAGGHSGGGRMDRSQGHSRRGR